MSKKIGRIYELSSSNTDETYIGSTIAPLKKRLSKHKYDIDHKIYKKRYSGSKLFKKNNNLKIKKLKKFKCTKEELLKKEYKYIKKSKTCINKRKDFILGCNLGKDYYPEYRKIKYECECGAIILRNNKARHTKSKKHLESKY